MKINLSKIPIFSPVCMIALLALAIFTPRNLIAIPVAAVIVLLFAMAPFDEEIMVLLFSVNFIAALSNSFSTIPLGSVLELLFIVKCFLNKRFQLKWTQAFFLLGIFAVSLISSQVLNASPVKGIVFIVNLLMMLAVFAHTKKIEQADRPNLVKKYYWSFIIGLISALVVSIFKTDMSSISYYNRFIGLWTDPNFIGLFAAIGMIMLIILAESKLRRYLLFSPLFLFLLFCGYLTYSRTFAIAIFMIAGYLVVVVLKSKKIHAVWKIASVLVVVVLAFLAYRYYLSDVFATRGIVDETGRDLTNGRLDDIQRAWRTYTSSSLHLVFGIGAETSHSTLFDIFFKFGPGGMILILALTINLIVEIHRHKKSNKLIMDSPSRILYLVLLLYAISLPMFEDDLMYLLFGCIPLGFAEKNLPEPTDSTEAV